MKINKKLLRRWIEVLRSRKYKQGTGVLRKKGASKKSVDRYCCLGVLCDIVGKTNWKKNDYDDDYSYQGKGDIYAEDATLPSSVYKKIGISLDEHELIVMNDDGGKKFYEIANYLERTYLDDRKG